MEPPELRIDQLRLPINAWCLLMDFGAREHSFSDFIVSHFPDSGGVFMCLARQAPGRQQPEGTDVKYVPAPGRVEHRKAPAMHGHAIAKRERFLRLLL